MTLKETIACRYDTAIKETKVQIELPATATPLRPQAEYNRRYTIEHTGKEPGKYTAGLKKIVQELEREKALVLKGLEMTCFQILQDRPELRQYIREAIGFDEKK